MKAWPGKPTLKVWSLGSTRVENRKARFEEILGLTSPILPHSSGVGSSFSEMTAIFFSSTSSTVASEIWDASRWNNQSSGRISATRLPPTRMRTTELSGRVPLRPWYLGLLKRLRRVCFPSQVVSQYSRCEHQCSALLIEYVLHLKRQRRRQAEPIPLPCLANLDLQCAWNPAHVPAVDLVLTDATI